jgi:REJ domain
MCKVQLQSAARMRSKHLLTNSSMVSHQTYCIVATVSCCQTTYTVPTPVPTAAPTLLPVTFTAQFTSGGSSVLVTLSSAVAPITTALSTGNDAALDCTSIIAAATTAKAGAAFRCKWRTDSVFELQLGVGASLLPDTSTSPSTACVDAAQTVTAGVLSMTGALADVHLSSTCSPLLLPAAPSQPRVSLVAPQTLGACDTVLTVDGSGSSSATARPLTAVWSYTASDGTAPAVAAVVAAAGSPSLVLSVPREQLQNDVAYTFTLTLTTFVGGSSAASVTVTPTAAVSPQLLAVGASQVEVARGQPLILTVTAVRSACSNDTDTSIASLYSWQLLQRTEAVAGVAQLDSTLAQYTSSGDARVLAVPALQLGYPGSSYVFRATAAYASNSTVYAYVDMQVSVVFSKDGLFSAIAGGSRRLVVYEQLMLDAVANDIDQLDTLPLRYAWNCSLQGVAGACRSLVEASTAASVTIRADTLQVNSAYEFSVRVERGNANSSNVWETLRSSTATAQVSNHTLAQQVHSFVSSM